jgi:hypothetical protein
MHVWGEGLLGENIMIPDFDDNGYLPAGIHPASLEEIESYEHRKPA